MTDLISLKHFDEKVISSFMKLHSKNSKKNKLALTQENLPSGVGEQHRRRPACASAQTDQRLCNSLIEKKILSRLATSEISIF